jgi:hypothetical protein
MKRGVTRAASIAAPPEAVLGLLADPTTLPRWAPGFARSVRADGPGAFVVDSVRGILRLVAEVHRDAGTVDYHLTAPDGSTSTVFLRALRSEEGAELVFTLLLPATATDGAVAAQGAIMEQELAQVRALCERG